MTIKAVELEYWSIQRKTLVLGEPRPVFWQEEGTGRWDTEEDARAAIMRDFAKSEVARVLHVVKRIEYSEVIPVSDEEMNA